MHQVNPNPQTWFKQDHHQDALSPHKTSFIHFSEDFPHLLIHAPSRHQIMSDAIFFAPRFSPFYKNEAHGDDSFRDSKNYPHQVMMGSGDPDRKSQTPGEIATDAERKRRRRDLDGNTCCGDYWKGHSGGEIRWNTVRIFMLIHGEMMCGEWCEECETAHSSWSPFLHMRDFKSDSDLSLNHWVSISSAKCSWVVPVDF